PSSDLVALVTILARVCASPVASPPSGTPSRHHGGAASVSSRQCPGLREIAIASKRCDKPAELGEIFRRRERELDARARSRRRFGVIVGLRELFHGLLAVLVRDEQTDVEAVTHD